MNTAPAPTTCSHKRRSLFAFGALLSFAQIALGVALVFGVDGNTSYQSTSPSPAFSAQAPAQDDRDSLAALQRVNTKTETQQDL